MSDLNLNLIQEWVHSEKDARFLLDLFQQRQLTAAKLAAFSENTLQSTFADELNISDSLLRTRFINNFMEWKKQNKLTTEGDEDNNEDEVENENEQGKRRGQEGKPFIRSDNTSSMKASAKSHMQLAGEYFIFSFSLCEATGLLLKLIYELAVCAVALQKKKNKIKIFFFFFFFFSPLFYLFLIGPTENESSGAEMIEATTAVPFGTEASTKSDETKGKESEKKSYASLKDSTNKSKNYSGNGGGLKKKGSEVKLWFEEHTVSKADQWLTRIPAIWRLWLVVVSCTFAIICDIGLFQ
ncbi:hypothetical protein RFI_10592 [Reticulomyxa filosa]|uniref:Uncharacterized protein n=1 Tax=Reticulomyxa filosa TaxID=46433 RepID=X6NKV7_RETFI|nr:hypothetical protein RFI_10592 [Reticulomyxa filosa]|eukprot:ETO26548.1 hypothetical protein RFI_10592 [Reticulomyxa filosa]